MGERRGEVVKGDIKLIAGGKMSGANWEVIKWFVENP